MDFTKFVSLLDKKALFFASGVLMRDIDKREGTRTREDVNNLGEAEKPILIVGASAVGYRPESIEKYIVVNCWNMKPTEDELMWSKYVQMRPGVAVQSTFAHLAESFTSSNLDVHIGEVKYIDHWTDRIEDTERPSGFLHFMHKNSIYQSENELRAMSMLNDRIIRPEIEKNKLSIRESEMRAEFFQNKGIYISVDLQQLVDSVVLSPGAQNWFSDLVRSVMEKYGLEKEVVFSREDDEVFG
jgi:hypothetical protein